MFFPVVIAWCFSETLTYDPTLVLGYDARDCETLVLDAHGIYGLIDKRRLITASEYQWIMFNDDQKLVATAMEVAFFQLCWLQWPCWKFELLAMSW